MDAVAHAHGVVQGGDKNGARGAQAHVHRARAHAAGADGRRGVVAGARANHDARGKAKLGGHIGQDGTDLLVTLVDLRDLGAGKATELKHGLGPIAGAHVKQQGARGVRDIGRVGAAQQVVDVVLGQHHVGDVGVVLGLVVAHPQDLGRGEAGVGNVTGPLHELLDADLFVEVAHLLGGATVVPQNGGTNDLVIYVQGHQAVHLAGNANARDLRSVLAGEKGRDAAAHGLPPVGGALLAPARTRELDVVGLAHDIQDVALLVHEQEFARRSSQVNTDEQHCLLLWPDFYKPVL